MRKLACILIVAACSEGGGSQQINITQMVGTAGGTVSGGDGSQVVIPMGALGSSSNITISTVSAAAPTGTVLVGPAYNFGPEGTTFNTPVTVTLPFDSSKFPAGKTSSDILIYTAPSGSTNYLALQTSVAANTVQTTTSHFTVYLPAVTAGGPPDLGGGGNCSPTCSMQSGGCGCSAVCGGHTYSLICEGTSSVSCFCEIDGATQSTPVSASCGSGLQSAFSQCLG